jgi:hypothetical protein
MATQHAPASMSAEQFKVLLDEVRAIEVQTTKTVVIVADTVGQLRSRLDAAIASGTVTKEFLSDLSAQLEIQERVAMAAIMASNLATRLSGDLAPEFTNAAS